MRRGGAVRAGWPMIPPIALVVKSLRIAVSPSTEAALLERHCHLSLPPPYKATGAAGPFQRECQRKAIRHYTWSDHVQCSARLGELADQAQDRTSVKFDHPGFEYLIPGLVPFCDVSHGDVPPCSDPQRA